MMSTMPSSGPKLCLLPGMRFGLRLRSSSLPLGLGSFGAQDLARPRPVPVQAVSAAHASSRRSRLLELLELLYRRCLAALVRSLGVTPDLPALRRMVASLMPALLHPTAAAAAFPRASSFTEGPNSLDGTELQCLHHLYGAVAHSAGLLTQDGEHDAASAVGDDTSRFSSSASAAGGDSPSSGLLALVAGDDDAALASLHTLAAASSLARLSLDGCCISSPLSRLSESGASETASSSSSLPDGDAAFDAEMESLRLTILRDGGGDSLDSVLSAVKGSLAGWCSFSVTPPPTDAAGMCKAAVTARTAAIPMVTVCTLSDADEIDVEDVDVEVDAAAMATVAAADGAEEASAVLAPYTAAPAQGPETVAGVRLQEFYCNPLFDERQHFANPMFADAASPPASPQQPWLSARGSSVASSCADGGSSSHDGSSLFNLLDCKRSSGGASYVSAFSTAGGATSAAYTVFDTTAHDDSSALMDSRDWSLQWHNVCALPSPLAFPSAAGARGPTSGRALSNWPDARRISATSTHSAPEAGAFLAPLWDVAVAPPRRTTGPRDAPALDFALEDFVRNHSGSTQQQQRRISLSDFSDDGSEIAPVCGPPSPDCCTKFEVVYLEHGDLSHPLALQQASPFPCAPSPSSSPAAAAAVAAIFSGPTTPAMLGAAASSAVSSECGSRRSSRSSTGGASSVAESADESAAAAAAAFAALVRVNQLSHGLKDAKGDLFSAPASVALSAPRSSSTTAASSPASSTVWGRSPAPRLPAPLLSSRSGNAVTATAPLFPAPPTCIACVTLPAAPHYQQRRPAAVKVGKWSAKPITHIGRVSIPRAPAAAAAVASKEEPLRASATLMKQVAAADAGAGEEPDDMVELRVSGVMRFSRAQLRAAIFGGAL